MGKTNPTKNEAKRLEALQPYHILDSLPEEEYDEITLMAAHICQTPIALISMVDEDRLWFKSKQGLKATQIPREIALCSHAILNPKEPLIVEDATKDARFATNPLVVGAPNLRFYAGIPISNGHDFALGALCVMDYEPRQLSCFQLESLSILAQSVNHRLKERKRNLRLQTDLNSFKLAVNTASIVSQTDKKGRITYVNDRFKEISGFTEAELVGQSHRILNSGHHPKAFFTEMWKTIAAGKTWRGEIINRAKNGTYYWVDSVITPMKDLEGKIEGYLSIRNLITEQKKAEEALQNSHQKYKHVVEHINDGLLIDDEEGRVVFGNNRFLEMFGLTENELPNLMLEDYVAPEHRAALRERHNRRIAGEKVPEVFEFEGLAKDGTRPWFEVRVSTILENGIIKGTQSAIIDITERKKDEALLTRINRVVSVKTGAKYFSELTAFLSSQLGVKYVFVGKYLPELDMVETISFRGDQIEQANFRYFLAGTPCGNAIKDTTCAYPSNVQSYFPDDEDLKTLGAESYLGIQLRDEANEVIGIIVLLDDKPMQDVEEKMRIVSIAAPRTANEIKQRNVINQLKKSEEKYRNLFQKMNEGLVLTSPSGTMQIVNPGFAEITGYSETELLGQNIYELLHKEEKRAFIKGKIKQREAHISEHYEEEFITKGGDTIWVGISASPLELF